MAMEGLKKYSDKLKVYMARRKTALKNFWGTYKTDAKTLKE